MSEHAPPAAPPQMPPTMGESHSTHSRPQTSSPHPQAPRKSSTGWYIIGGALVVIAVAGGYWFSKHSGASATAAVEGTSDEESRAEGTIRVEVAYPRKGGEPLTMTQPGTVHAYDEADLYAKVSGYLKVQKVDIGDMVQEGDLLAEIEVPEAVKAVEQAAALLQQARAKTHVVEARIETTEAEKKAAETMVAQAEADLEKTTAALHYRKKQLERITKLVSDGAVEPRLLDEEQDNYESAVAAEHAAQAFVLTSKAQVLAAAAKVDQAKADLLEAKANVAVADADLAKAKVLLDYTRITSPYTGVVTRREFHRGDFIRSAADGGAVPMLSVAKTDVMRVVVPVPDRYVPYVDKGDPALVRVDALPGQSFHGAVSRFSYMEDPENRTMRTEVDLPNPDNKLHEGMYGGVTLTLSPASDNLTIPSSSLVEQLPQARGTVYVVRDGKVHKVEIRVGRDNGLDVEVVEGLKPDDQIVVSYNGSITEGTPVQVEKAQVAGTTGSAESGSHKSE